MEQLKLSTVVYAPQQDVYDVLVDFEQYPNFCEYVNRVARRGDGAAGTKYGIEFGWWKLSYMAWSRVSGLDEPREIRWEIIKDIDANGRWEIEDVAESIDEDVEHASRVVIDVEFEVRKSGDDILDLPMFTSFDWVVDKVKPKVFTEARSVIENLVYELEGRRRTPELKIHETPRHVTKQELRQISG